MERVSEQIEPILLHAEQQLRAVIAKAAEVGDYDGVDLAREVAARIKSMLPLITSRGSSGHNGKPQDDSRAASAAERPPRKARVGKRAEYPQFLIRKGILLKVGWSKKEKKEYVHKLPRDAYRQAVTAIDTLTKNGVRPLAADQIVEQTELAGNPVPIYQVYVALAFLRDSGIVRRDGRDGYLVVDKQKFTDRAELLWSEA